MNINICCIGESFPNNKVTYLGRVNRKKLIDIMGKSKLTFMNAENYLSLYVLDCIRSNLKIFINRKEFSYLKRYFFKESFLTYNSSSSDLKIAELILNYLTNYKKYNMQKIAKQNVNKINKENINYFSNLRIK